MTDVWPVALPQSLEISGYSESVADNLLEYQPDTGPTITRRRSTAGAYPISGSIVLTESQLGVFKTFFYTTVLSGSLPFTFPIQVSPSIGVLVKFSKESLPRWSPIGGGYWRLNMTLMVMP
jgi:hypothetical protein